MHHINLDRIITQALMEDMGSGDITTQTVVPPTKQIQGKFIAKETGIVCGLEVAQRVFHLVDSAIEFSPLCKDGDSIDKGGLIAEIAGPAQGILTGERLALNFLQRLSGIATKTRQMVESIQGSQACIVDTRKTTPGLRMLEKYAVRTGGGRNHRMNLADGILIKDNHIQAAGSITRAVAAAKSKAPSTLKIEVETENIHQVEEALLAGADIIMLDNMDLKQMRQAVELIDGRALVEASGNMDEKDLLEVALSGVDIISVGALTHSVKAFDISLKLQV